MVSSAVERPERYGPATRKWASWRSTARLSRSSSPRPRIGRRGERAEVVARSTDSRERRDRRDVPVAEALAQRARRATTPRSGPRPRVVADERDLRLHDAVHETAAGRQLDVLGGARVEPERAVLVRCRPCAARPCVVTMPPSAPETAARRSAVITKCTPSGRLSATRRGSRSTSSPRLMRSKARRTPRSRRTGHDPREHLALPTARLYSESVNAPRAAKRSRRVASVLPRSSEQASDALLVLAQHDAAAVRQRLERLSPRVAKSRP